MFCKLLLPLSIYRKIHKILLRKSSIKKGKQISEFLQIKTGD